MAMNLHERALRCLAQREHSRAELARKLGELGSDEEAAARKACLYLKGFALLKDKKYAQAAKVLNALKAEPREIDNRLLKLTAAVAARQVPVSKLNKYARRASYRYQAKVLRELAAEITAAGDEN